MAAKERESSASRESKNRKVEEGVKKWKEMTNRDNKQAVKSGNKWKDAVNKSKADSKFETKDPTSLELFKEAARRNAELKDKIMTDQSQRRSEDKVHALERSSRSKHKKTSNSRDASGTEGRRSKNSTDNAKQIKQDNLKHINGLSQLSSDKFPPQSNTQRVVYFQNRFIILDAADRSTGSTNLTINNDDKHGRNHDKIKPSDKMDSMETSFSKINSTSDSKHKTNRKDIEMDASSVTMDARGIDIILTDPDNSSKQIKNMDSFNTEESKDRNSIWRKINRVLLDDRVKASNGQIVLENRHPEEYRILKKVLNILFLTIGITLFVSVIIVVIYAFIVGDEKSDSYIQPTTTSTITAMAASSSTTPNPP